MGNKNVLCEISKREGMSILDLRVAVLGIWANDLTYKPTNGVLILIKHPQHSKTNDKFPGAL